MSEIFYYTFYQYHNQLYQRKLWCYCSPLGNIGYNKSTSQTLDYGDYTSDRAVDGITDNPSCAHTYVQVNRVWWRVDLGQLHRIYNVTLYECELVTLCESV